MIIKNCNIIFSTDIKKGSITINNGKISEIILDNNIKNLKDNLVIDGRGLYISPGFIDTHIHGAGDYDTMDGTFEAINSISKTVAKYGVTSLTPTTMTVDKEDIKKALKTIYLSKNKTEGANILGVHLEGPFISPSAIGAQNPKFVVPPSVENFKSIVGEYEDIINCVTLAPEVYGAKELIEYLKTKGIIASIGHTKATYEEAMEGIKWGCTHSTHLFNAMSPFSHRSPGTVGAIFDSDITTETICDGIHIKYPALRTAYKQKGLDNVLLITDAMMACGMKDAIYSLGKQEVKVENGAARLLDGTLAGSILTLNVAINNLHKNTNYKLNELISMTTLNPAKHCKIQHRKGLIKLGYDADLTIFDDNIDIKYTIVNGKVVYKK